MIQQTLLQSLASMAREEVAATARTANETATEDTFFLMATLKKMKGRNEKLVALQKHQRKQAWVATPQMPQQLQMMHQVRV